MTAKEFVDLFEQHRYDFFAGVPCSLLAGAARCRPSGDAPGRPPSSIGLGVALTRPRRTAVIFDGDGNLLMNLGTLSMVGGLQPKNFVHLVFDNEAYGSTGNQLSRSREVRLDRLAAAAGYPWVCATADPGALEAATREALATDGPAFILVKVTAQARAVPRIPYSPPEIRDRFRAALGAD